MPASSGLPSSGVIDRGRAWPGLRIHPPVVGDLELSYETMQLAADAGLNLSVYTAEPGSTSQQALDILASWSATPQTTRN